jgi:hypothetical protein
MRPAFSSGHSSSFLLGQIADCIIIFLYLFRDRKVKPPLERNIIKEGQSIQKKQGILLTFLNWTIKLTCCASWLRKTSAKCAIL